MDKFKKNEISILEFITNICTKMYLNKMKYQKEIKETESAFKKKENQFEYNLITTREPIRTFRN